MSHGAQLSRCITGFVSQWVMAHTCSWLIEKEMVRRITCPNYVSQLRVPITCPNYVSQLCVPMSDRTRKEVKREGRRRLCLGRRVEPCDYTWLKKHESITRVSLSLRDMAYSYVSHDAFMCDVAYSFVDTLFLTMVFICVTWLVSFVWHDPFKCVTQLMYILIFIKSPYLMQYMTHSNICHDSVTCVTWLIHVWHDSFIYVTWLIHILTQMSSRFPKYSAVDRDNTENIVLYPVLRLCVTALQRCLCLHQGVSLYCHPPGDGDRDSKRQRCSAVTQSRNTGYNTIWTSHGAYMNESWHLCECITAWGIVSHGAYMKGLSDVTLKRQRSRQRQRWSAFTQSRNTWYNTV